jgi:hypothetical protein
MTRYQPLWLQSGSYAASVDRHLVSALWPAARCDGCQVTFASAMSVNVAAGYVAVPTVNNSGSTLCVSDAVEQVALPPAPAAGLNRIDLITCNPRGNDLDGGQNNDFIFGSVQGAEAATPVAPATPAGRVALAQIYLVGGSAAIDPARITDVRPSGLAVPADPKASLRYTHPTFTTPATAMQAIDIPYTSKVFDDLNAYNTSTLIWTCKVAGAYLFSFQVAENFGAGYQRNLTSLKNGVQIYTGAKGPWTGATGTTYGEIPGIFIDRCVIGDAYRFQLNSGAVSTATRLGPESALSIGYLHS